jgi:hypothetical protein
MPGVMRHLSDAWARRWEPNLVLVHYHDLSTDLGGNMRDLAARLGIAIHESAWPSLVRAATFEQMRSRAEQLAPDTRGILKARSRFFRRGVSGRGRCHLSEHEVSDYVMRANTMASAELLRWLHRPL